MEYSKNPHCLTMKINEQRQRRESELEMQRKLKEMDEMSECTFAPAVSCPAYLSAVCKLADSDLNN